MVFFRIMVLGLILSVLVPSMTQADTIMLLNGQKLYGKIANINSPGQLAILDKSNQIKSVPWSDIAGVAIDKARLKNSEIGAPIDIVPRDPGIVEDSMSLGPIAQAENQTRFAYAPRLTTTRRPYLRGWGGLD